MAVPPRPARKSKSLKRPNGTGSVNKLKDKNIWAAQYYVLDPVTGNKKRKTKKFRTRKLALEFLESWNHSNRTGEYKTVADSKITVRELLENHNKRYVAKKAPETLRNYEGAAKRISDEIGGVPANNLSPHDVEDLLDSLAAKYSKNTVANAFAVLRAAYNKAVKMGDLLSNPCLKIDSPARELNPTQHIPEGDFKAIYEAASLHPYSHARIEIGMFVPIRPGETLGLKWDDIDWEKGTLNIERQLQWVKGDGLVLRETKNKKSRVIPISKTTLDILKTHKSYQDMQKDNWVEDAGLIFPNTVGKPLDAKRDYKWWLDILERAGVRHYQLYQMRKTAISNLENLGTPSSTILKFTGHSSMSVVYNHYATSTDQADSTALAGLDAIRERVLFNDELGGSR